MIDCSGRASSCAKREKGGQATNLAMIEKSDLPDFRTPPAIETLVGFCFAPLKGWQTPFFGLFWNAIRKDYPRVEVQPFLMPEQVLKLELKSEKARLEISGEVPVRWMYFHRS